ncbi:MAG: hypothetical protein EPN84_09780 [Legionella sp.]|nr:MAG: hypothetical protein EPN84_09780 [Legionella sp.]
MMRTLNLISKLLLSFCLVVSTQTFARGGGGGGFHAGGGGGFNGGFHNGGINNGGFNNGFHNNNGYNYHGYDYNNFHGAYDNNNVGYDGAVVVGAPATVYDDSTCQSNQVCNAAGQCWSEDDCD